MYIEAVSTQNATCDESQDSQHTKLSHVSVSLLPLLAEDAQCFLSQMTCCFPCPRPVFVLTYHSHPGYSLEEDQTGGMEDLICKHLPLPFGNLLGFLAAPGSVFELQWIASQLCSDRGSLFGNQTSEDPDQPMWGWGRVPHRLCGVLVPYSAKNLNEKNDRPRPRFLECLAQIAFNHKSSGILTILHYVSLR